MQQVLEAVLPRIRDVRTLMVCSLLSQECRQQAQQAVRANLPALIQQCRLLQLTDQDKLRQLQWLCKTASPAAVNTHGAGCEILHLLSGLKSVSTAPGALKETGLHITTDMFIYAMAKTNWSQEKYTMQHQVDLHSVDKLYKWAAFLRFENDDEREEWSQFRASVPHITALQLPTLLRIACSVRYPSMQVLEMLLDHDRDHVHLLHSSKAADPQPMRAGVSSADTKALSPQQQQQQPGLQLLMELITVVIKGRSRRTLQRLCNVPLANALDRLHVTKLLYVAACHLEYVPKGPNSEAIPAATVLLSSLPGAQRASPGCLATLVYHGLHTNNWQLVDPLIKLPNFNMAAPNRVCQLMLAAANAKRPKLRSFLFKLGALKALEGRHVLHVIKACMEEPELLQDKPAFDAFFENEAGKLDQMQVGRFIGAEGMLELLEHCTNRFQSLWSTICKIQPAASQLTNTPRFLRILKGIVMLPLEYDPFEDLLEHAKGGDLPVMHQLTAADWFEVLCSALQNGSGFIPGVLELPVMQDMSSECIVRLLQLCIRQQETEVMQTLLALPAAQALAPDAVAELLLQLLQPFGGRYEWSFDSGTWAQLLALPSAQQVPVSSLQQVIDTAWDMGLASVVESLLQSIPAAAGLECGLPSEWVVHGIMAACSRGLFEDARKLIDHPSMKGLSPSNLVRLVVKLLGALGKGVQRGQSLQLLLQDLQRLPSWQEVFVQDLLRIVDVCISLKCDEQLAVLLACPAAAEVSTAAILQLLGDICMGSGASVWRALLQLPAAQQLTPAALVSILTEYLARHRADLDSTYGGKRDIVVGVVQVLLQHPASLQFTAADIQGCVLEVLSQGSSRLVVSLLLQHPAGQQLSAEALVDMLYVVAEHRYADAAYARLLLQQPAAGNIDPLSMCELAVRFMETGSVRINLSASTLNQLTPEQVRELFEQALQFGDAALCRQLSLLPVVKQGTDPELRVLIDAVGGAGFVLGARVATPQSSSSYGYDDFYPGW